MESWNIGRMEDWEKMDEDGFPILTFYFWYCEIEG